MSQGATGARAGMRSFVQDEFPIDDDIFDAVAVLERVIVSGAVLHPAWIENSDVGEQTGSQKSTIANACFGSIE